MMTDSRRIGGSQAFQRPLTPLVGREDEIAVLLALLSQQDIRLLTLTGPGGVGKTRLALQVAEDARDLFDSLVFVPLAAIREPALVLPAIAQAIGVPDAPETALIQRLTHLLGSGRHLLLLDNFEQVVEAASSLAQLLAGAPGLSILVTSRAVLRVHGEHEFPVSPLALPMTEDHLQRSLSVDEAKRIGAIALFVQRARAADPKFVLSDDNIATVATICRKLDGLPLAIELAAARMRLLSAEALVALLERRLVVLTGGPRDQPERLQTMRQAIAWSYGLLSPREQALFRRLSVFAGGFDMEAAAAVVGNEGKDSDAPFILDDIAALADQSLLVRSRSIGSRATPIARFAMLETLREYGLERLTESRETETTRERHAAWCVALAECAEPELVGPRQGEWLDHLESEHDNLRTALAWSIERGTPEPGMRLAGALWWFWWLRGYRAIGQAALERLLAAPAEAPRPVRAKALLAAGALGVGGAAPAKSAALLAESLALYRELEDETGVALVLFSLGYMAAFQGDWQGARRSIRDALERFRIQNNRWGVGGALCGLGFVALYTGDLNEAHTRFAEALAVNREAGDPQGIATSLFGLATIALVRGDATAAMEFAQEGLGLTRAIGERGQVPPRLEILAAAVGASGDAARSARLFGVASSLREVVGLPLPAMAPPGYEQRVAAVRSALGESAFAAAWATGRALKLDDVLAESIAEAPARTSSASVNYPAQTQPGGLTPRELMVLRLLVDGHSDPEIAEALFVSRRTVATHVVHIFRKFGVHSRAAASAHAVRLGLA